MTRLDRAWVSAAGRHGKGYVKPQVEVSRLTEKEALGTAVGARGYTTLDQAGTLCDALGLAPGRLLLDVGSGRGWPGLYLAQISGCEVVSTDLPTAALRAARSRAKATGVRAWFVQASGSRLPFRARTFEAAVNTDVL